MLVMKTAWKISNCAKINVYYNKYIIHNITLIK